jgi:arylsulfatase A-like enzyme
MNSGALDNPSATVLAVRGRQGEVRWRLLPVLALLSIWACGNKPTGAALHLLPSGAREEPVAVGRTSGMGFEVPVGQEQVVRFKPPTQPARLRLACAWVLEAGERARGSMVFRALIRGGTRNPTTLLDETVASGSWVERTVELPPTSRSELELVLTATFADPSLTGTAYWATPVVLTQGDQRPNLVLISVDCLRADHLGCYGYPRATSPTIDSLAAAGCLFKRAIAQSSWTLPSHVSLLTSLYLKSHRAGAYEHHLRGAPEGLRAEVETLAELLRGAGYLTLAIVSGSILHPAYGLSQGFDLYDAECSVGGPTVVRNPCVHERVSALLSSPADQPFFLFVHYWDVHAPYVPPPPYDTLFLAETEHDPGSVSRSDPGATRRDSLEALYDGEIAHTDRHLGMLFRELRESGVGQNTVVILTGDHGDEFEEHGAYGHGHSLFQELIRVPLIWAMPGKGSRARAIENLVQLVDIVPTVLEFVGLDIPPQMEGRSFLSLLEGRAQEPRPSFSEVRGYADLNAAIAGDSKVIFSLPDLRYFAYNLAVDPGEQHPLSPEDVPHGKDLEEMLASSFPPLARELSTLEIRAQGEVPRGELALTVRGRWRMEVTPVNLEETDSLEVLRRVQVHEEVHTELVLLPECSTGDTDGLSILLSRRMADVAVDARFRGRPVDRRIITLGSGGHPPGVPFRIGIDDPGLRRRPGSYPPSPSGAPQIFLWVAGPENQAAPVPEIDSELREELRALGYVE